MKDLLILSPHSDDTAFSLAAIVGSEFIKKRFRLHQLTLFRYSNHCPYRSFESVDLITKTRSDEDRSFADEHGILLETTEQREGMLRGFPAVESLFQDGDPKLDSAFKETVSLVKKAVKKLQSPFICAPAAIGGHIEHKVVREAAYDVGANDLLLYEDLPYAEDYSEKEIQCNLRGFGGEPAQPLSVVADSIPEWKCSALLHYPSQVSQAELDKVNRFHARRRCVYQNRVDAGVVSEYTNQEILWSTSNIIERFKLNFNDK